MFNIGSTTESSTPIQKDDLVIACSYFYMRSPYHPFIIPLP